MKNRLILTLTTLILSFPLSMFGQAVPKGVDKTTIQRDAVITSKKWVCLEVKRKKLTKMDFKFEVGNELSLSIDKKYSFKNNDYNYQSGTWREDGKYLYFFYNALDGTNRTNSTRYKIIKLNPSILVLKRTEKPRGKLIFK